MEQDLLTLLGHLSLPPSFSRVRVARSLVLCVCFVDCCFSSFFSPLCCLFFFDIQILITPLVSSNYSELEVKTWSVRVIFQIILSLIIRILRYFKVSPKWTTTSHLKSLNAKRSWHMLMQIQVMAWDRQANFEGLNRLMGF